MADKKEMLDARDIYLKIIKSELLGPGSEHLVEDDEHEIISDNPINRYALGILYPINCHYNAENDDSRSAGAEDSDGENDVEEEMPGEFDSGSGTDDHNEPVYDFEEHSIDEQISLANQNKPSSMGISFIIDGKPDSISFNVKFAVYRHTLLSDLKVPFDIETLPDGEIPGVLTSRVEYDQGKKSLKLIQSLKWKDVEELREHPSMSGVDNGIFIAMRKLVTMSNGFIREPYTISVNIPFGEGDYFEKNNIVDDVDVKVSCLRTKLEDGRTAITLMLVNNKYGYENIRNVIFQPVIEVRSEDNGFRFSEIRTYRDFGSLDAEEKSLELQYRNKKNYCSGLGTATVWDVDANGTGFVASDSFPESELPTLDFNLPKRFNVEPKVLSMKFLSDFDKTDREDKLAGLENFVGAYAKWIDEVERKIGGLEPYFTEVAKNNIMGCRKSCQRMFAGLEAIRSDELKWQAFQLANRAMYMQRAHIKLQEESSMTDHYDNDTVIQDVLDRIEDEGYEHVDEFIKDYYSWRPFQLAFLLMSVESVTDDRSEDRDVVDLIWFPTGGGKTEAYLGLTAMTIFYRRMKYPTESGGTAVIMRYTLRLLAAQQFTRAATLICACEYIRQDATAKKSRYGKYPLGTERITIGLWIGGEHTSNRNQQANENISKLNRAKAAELRYAKEKYNKFQTLKCPWCGTKIVKDVVEGKLKGAFGYRMTRGHFEMSCVQDGCPFEERLPVQVVDEELYLNPPTLLFGTVDKFAMLPWKEDVGRFFGVGNNNRCPELIIQDELHLISGPLGSVVGLYETAFDIICSDKGGKTKIVASTATIRRAKEQCAALYNREVAQFPHPAIDAEDTFFARENAICHDEGIYGRKYIGLMPSGKTKAMMEAKTIATFMQRIYVMDFPDEIKDNFWTLTVYFNSLKDLGKCSNLVEDDVKEIIHKMSKRLNTKKRFIGSADELTSRVSTTELNETLDKLEKRKYSKENIEAKIYPSNILLATNMISVGIDVARLNVMLLVGQPKLTSEFIQASSRVGRSYPGMAFVLYDASKSRDKSHYEQFRAYHESFYKFVEPTGVTPFSAPVRERALHALFIAAVRNIIPELASDNAANLFDRRIFSDRLKNITDYIIERNTSIIRKVNPDMSDDEEIIRNEIESICEDWERMIIGMEDGKFTYGEKFIVKHPANDEGRLLKPYNSSVNDSAFNTMTSMRNVDTSVKTSVILWED